MDFNAVEIHRLIGRHEEILVAIDTRRVDVHVMTTLREGDSQAMYRTDRAAITDGWIVSRNYVKDAQRFAAPLTGSSHHAVASVPESAGASGSERQQPSGGAIGDHLLDEIDRDVGRWSENP